MYLLYKGPERTPIGRLNCTFRDCCVYVWALKYYLLGVVAIRYCGLLWLTILSLEIRRRNALGGVKRSLALRERRTDRPSCNLSPSLRKHPLAELCAISIEMHNAVVVASRVLKIPPAAGVYLASQ